jgi:hypothetical protein
LAYQRVDLVHLVWSNSRFFCHLLKLSPMLYFPQCGYGIFNPWTVS